MAETLPPPISGTPMLQPVAPPPGAPDHRQHWAGRRADEQPASPPAPAVEKLDFLDPAAFEKALPLDFPFRHDGIEIYSIRVRRLTVAEVAAWARANEAGRADAFDLYAIMAGLPAPVIRGLESGDGASLMEAVHDFLPRWLRTDAASPATPPAGAPTP